MKGKDAYYYLVVSCERHHDQGNSYRGQHLIGAGLQGRRFRPLSSLQQAWQCPGRHDAGGAQSSTSCSKAMGVDCS